MAQSGEWTLSLSPPWPAAASRVADPPLSQLSDAALAEASAAGRAGAFDLIVECHRRGVYRLCYRFAGNHADASDLTQETFLRAYRGLDGFRGRSSLATWLYRIGVNVCLSNVGGRAGAKARAAERLEEQPDIETRDDSPSEQLLKAERQAVVRAAIATLPNKQRAALILRIYHDLSHKEIADALGSSVGAVKTNLFHAVNSLRKRLRPGDL
jgi:RNA polymerase sigma-70 factor (ECF subfamily)